MIVRVDMSRAEEAGAVALLEADDLKAFKLVAGGDSDGRDLATALGSVGTMADEDHAWIRIDALRELAGDRAEDPDWIAGFDGMVAYAASKGWVSEDGASLRAHCEYASVEESSPERR